MGDDINPSSDAFIPLSDVKFGNQFECQVLAQDSEVFGANVFPKIVQYLVKVPRLGRNAYLSAPPELQVGEKLLVYYVATDNNRILVALVDPFQRDTA